jgi:hypothetical protein
MRLPLPALRQTGSSRGIQRDGARHRARARSEIRAGDYRASRQMALRTRRKSTCRRTTSSGSVTLITPGSHVTNRTVQATSVMWTVRKLTSGGIHAPTCPRWRLFPAFPAPSGRSWRAVFPGRSFVASGWVRGETGPRRRRALRLAGSALAEPAQRRVRLGVPGLGRRLVLAVAPGAAGALLVAPPPARDADHASIVRRDATERELLMRGWGPAPHRRNLAPGYVGYRSGWRGVCDDCEPDRARGNSSGVASLLH